MKFLKIAVWLVLVMLLAYGLAKSTCNIPNFNSNTLKCAMVSTILLLVSITALWIPRIRKSVKATQLFGWLFLITISLSVISFGEIYFADEAGCVSGKF